MALTPRPSRLMPRLRLSAREAEALTLISRRLLDCSVPCDAAMPGRAAWRLSLTPGRNDAVRATCDREIAIDWSGARLHLRFPARAAALWLAARLGVDEAEALDPPLAEAVLEAMLDEVVERLALGGLGAPRWRHAPPVADPPLALAHAFVLAVRCDEEADVGPEAGGAPRSGVLACVETDAFGVMLLASLLARHPDRENDIAIDALPVPLRLVIGDAELRVVEMASLAAGDIVRCTRCTLGAVPWVAATAPDGRVWRMRLVGSASGETGPGAAGRLIFMGRGHGMTEGHFDETTFDVAPGADGPPAMAEDTRRDDAWIERMPVRLQFDLGTQVVPLGELRRLQPGQALDLERPSRAPVCIRANGMPIGWGDLVEIDGNIGIVIVALSERIHAADEATERTPAAT
ncbi:type III secretion system cytoplasmic ring protein SctQ [Robbsia sp. Bb-Pol-6]|uniref:Type III secretion system cytoplasmic ring protein SctQ n=1 Tax=Robbsia betulipollinis TaxID=2981849 RepID=A0ABT3ZLX9_9BURK|nr:type III secretion system cytoplasmic ring protein SctQ [Robbsia betulipollinis]MCY0387285.1 type III secretion system cytoplasmic ring protein SctQ [Robbsia betulipollinis]